MDMLMTRPATAFMKHETLRLIDRIFPPDDTQLNSQFMVPCRHQFIQTNRIFNRPSVVLLLLAFGVSGRAIVLFVPNIMAPNGGSIQ